MNKTVSPTALAVLAVLAALLLSTTAIAQPADQPMTGVSDLFRRIAVEVGKEFIVDPRVPPGIDAYTTADDPDFESVRALLRIYGYVAIETADQVLIIPEQNFRTSPSRVLHEDDVTVSDHEIVTRVLSVPTIPDRRGQNEEQPGANPFVGQIAPQLVPMLRPMLSQAAQMAASPGNKLIIVDYYDNVRRITAVIEAIVADLGD